MRGKNLLVISREKGGKYVALTTGSSARGRMTEELWVFGKPRTKTEHALAEDIRPLMDTIPMNKTHRIP